MIIMSFMINFAQAVLTWIPNIIYIDIQHSSGMVSIDDDSMNVPFILNKNPPITMQNQSNIIL